VIRDRADLEAFGRHIREWRRLSRLPAETVAGRAGITRDTLRALETGAGTTKLENVFAVLEALGLSSRVVQTVDPSSDERGRALLRRAAERSR
jgi:transcriptional regulator with XRE-family HTH domain